MSSFEWAWCWECNCPTINGKDWNLCCARWLPDSEEEIELQKRAVIWSKDNHAPKCPSSNEIDQKLNCDNYTKEEILFFKIFDHFTYGKYYWLPKQWADKIGHTIPTYEELRKKYEFEPKYDCKTGKQWSIDEKKNVYEKEGWISEENFEQEEIPYSEFCTRMRKSRLKHLFNERKTKHNDNTRT